MRSLLHIPQNIIDKIDFAIKLKAHELKLVKELCTILKPFEEATIISQGENVITSSEVIVCVRSLREQLEKLSEEFSCRLLTALQASLESRLSKYEDMEVFQLAATLDPRYKLDWCADDEVENIKRILVGKAEEIASGNVPEPQDGRPPPAKRARPGLGLMKDRYQSSSVAVGTLFEINDYLSHPCMPEGSIVC